MALGNDPEDLTSPAGLGKIMLASGGFGMYGDLMFGDSGDHKNGTLTKALGPGATMIEDALNLARNAVHTAQGTAGMEDAPGEPKAIPADKLGMQAVQFAHSYVAPLTRIWYVKAALNHLVYQRIMENLAPGGKPHGATQPVHLVADRASDARARAQYGRRSGPASSLILPQLLL
jgi:hypothetical protein